MSAVFRCDECDRGLGIRPGGLSRVIVVRCRRCKAQVRIDVDGGSAGDVVRCAEPHPSLPSRACGALLVRRQRRQVFIKCPSCKQQRPFPPAAELRTVARIAAAAGRDLTPFPVPA